VDVPVTWTGPRGHLLHESWTPPWIRDGLTALISELEAAAPPGLDHTRAAFRSQGQLTKLGSLSPVQRRDTAISRLLDQRVELLVAMKLAHAGILTKISSGTPDFECSWQGREFGIEVTTRARLDVGAAMHNLLEEGLRGEPNIEVILARTGQPLFSKDPDELAAIAERIVTAIKERVAAAAGEPLAGGIPIPELGLTAMLHSVVSDPGMRVTYESPLTEEQWDHHWRMAALQIKDSIEKKGRKTYALPSIVVLDVSRLGAAGQMPAEASWMGRFQNILDTCELGNLDGAVVMRSELVTENVHPLCWRGEESLVAATVAALLDGRPLVPPAGTPSVADIAKTAVPAVPSWSGEHGARSHAVAGAAGYAIHLLPSLVHRTCLGGCRPTIGRRTPNPAQAQPPTS
jgi:hypothetical protein